MYGILEKLDNDQVNENLTVELDDIEKKRKQEVGIVERLLSIDFWIRCVIYSKDAEFNHEITRSTKRVICQ